MPEAVVSHRASASIVYDSSASVYYGHRNLEWVYVKNMPAGLILKSLLRHIVYDMAAFFYFLSVGRGTVFVRAKMDSIRGLRKMFEKRHGIQKSKTVSNDYLWNLFDDELFFPRLTRRLRNSQRDPRQ